MSKKNIFLSFSLSLFLNFTKPYFKPLSLTTFKKATVSIILMDKTPVFHFFFEKKKGGKYKERKYLNKKE